MWTVRLIEHELALSDRHWEQLLGHNFPPGRAKVNCVLTFFSTDADQNHNGALRLDIVLTFSDGITVRYHPKALWIRSTQPQPSHAMQQWIKLSRNETSKVGITTRDRNPAVANILLETCSKV